MKASAEVHMRRAIVLSQKGFPAPNPRVGCVIAKNGETLAEGWHDHAGGPHAEVVALTQASDAAKGADLYCTLEPCDHRGRTPPCTRAIIKAGIARAFIAVRDPNPEAAGGVRALEQAGIECTIGLLAAEAEEATRAFLQAHRTGRPYVVAKVATTADGFIARPDGTSKWITGEQARAEAHRLRAELGCVLVGANTVDLDDPLLTARVPGVVNQPLAAVLDPSARLEPARRVFQRKEVVRFVEQGRQSQPFDVGIPVSQGQFDLREVLGDLTSRGVIGVLVEGGAETIASFFRAGLVDRLEKFVSKQRFGEGKFWLGADPPEVLLAKIKTTRRGEDVQETFGTNSD